MADLDQLKSKYAGVISTLQEFSNLGATVDQVDLDGEKLHIKGKVPSKVVLNRVWDAIKQADPTYSDLHHEIVNTGGDDQPYTVQSGDNLSKIAKHFYGNANKYTEIAKTNNIANPDLIKVGQQLNLPAL
ncbi:LysM peptidoglycan-binding domain-containing protein [Occallatibacter savannae]|uniref:LysM peptidoglycan-binding domain-containing protein n=1 Tax=Occallatibacter savannae TaxID=1002691 RepID=UPI000D69633D|nr:LysM peptidoglycan-binding domain-containing protein [Occallatibacter savannae]